MHLPRDADSALGLDRDELRERKVLGIIEGSDCGYQQTATMYAFRSRNAPSQVSINWVDIPPPMAAIPLVPELTNVPLPGSGRTLGQTFEKMRADFRRRSWSR